MQNLVHNETDRMPTQHTSLLLFLAMNVITALLEVVVYVLTLAPAVALLFQLRRTHPVMFLLVLIGAWRVTVFLSILILLDIKRGFLFRIPFGTFPITSRRLYR